MSGSRRFELVRELGAGAFGTVYLADMISSGDFRKKVAIKLMNPQWGDAGDAGRRLRDEARLLGRLRHRSIVQVDDLVRLDGRWAVVMEHVPGVDLERLLEAAWKMQVNTPPPAGLEIVAAVAGALDAAYNGAPEGEGPLQVIHRDIKPSNIRITPDGDVKVLDFGIARAQFQGREAKTEQVRYGSLGYMAPERVLGDEDAPAGDVYAVGCVLVELLRGKALGRSALMPDQQEAQVKAAVDEIVPKLGEYGPSVGQLLHDCLAYEPASRPTAAELADRARRLARVFPGEDLSEFTRRFVPAVGAILGDDTKEAQGRLTEQAAGTLVPDNQTQPVDGGDVVLGTQGMALPHRSGEQRAPSEPTFALATGEARRRRKMGLGIGVGLLLCLGVGWALLRQGTGVPVAPAPPSPVASTAPSPTPSPTPTPAPTSAVGSTTPPVTAPSISTVAATSAAPSTPASTQKARTHTGTTEAAPAHSIEPETTAPPATAPTSDATTTLRAVKFTAADATNVDASCGSVHSSGSTSALLRDVPAGPCRISVSVGGKTYQTEFTVSEPRGVTCVLEEGNLACR